jgi:hypothetical protein
MTALPVAPPIGSPSAPRSDAGSSPRCGPNRRSASLAANPNAANPS